ncbi:hypothetical protein E5358_12640 [Palleniella muris]|uniref:Uncharacterized protein n=1 Tax=Palleniella muris TaxID=3038145 RepID=A0AC61QME2_9BACT|nr:hypothetical protein [Palleniella muris]TGX80498.1 hypothetical protein E5358_12640 [Palleniella muris]
MGVLIVGFSEYEKKEDNSLPEKNAQMSMLVGQLRSFSTENLNQQEFRTFLSDVYCATEEARMLLNRLRSIERKNASDQWSSVYRNAYAEAEKAQHNYNRLQELSEKFAINTAIPEYIANYSRGGDDGFLSVVGALLIWLLGCVLSFPLSIIIGRIIEIVTAKSVIAASVPWNIIYTLCGIWTVLNIIYRCIERIKWRRKGKEEPEKCARYKGLDDMCARYGIVQRESERRKHLDDMYVRLDKVKHYADLDSMQERQSAIKQTKDRLQELRRLTVKWRNMVNLQHELDSMKRDLANMKRGMSQNKCINRQKTLADIEECEEDIKLKKQEIARVHDEIISPENGIVEVNGIVLAEVGDEYYYFPKLTVVDPNKLCEPKENVLKRIKAGDQKTIQKFLRNIGGTELIYICGDYYYYPSLTRVGSVALATLMKNDTPSTAGKRPVPVAKKQERQERFQQLKNSDKYHELQTRKEEALKSAPLTKQQKKEAIKEAQMAVEKAEQAYKRLVKEEKLLRLRAGDKSALKECRRDVKGVRLVKVCGDYYHYPELTLVGYKELVELGLE